MHRCRLASCCNGLRRKGSLSRAVCSPPSAAGPRQTMSASAFGSVTHTLSPSAPQSALPSFLFVVTVASPVVTWGPISSSSRRCVGKTSSRVVPRSPSECLRILWRKSCFSSLLWPSSFCESCFAPSLFSRERKHPVVERHQRNETLHVISFLVSRGLNGNWTGCRLQGLRPSLSFRARAPFLRSWSDSRNCMQQDEFVSHTLSQYVCFGAALRAMRRLPITARR